MYINSVPCVLGDKDIFKVILMTDECEKVLFDEKSIILNVANYENLYDWCFDLIDISLQKEKGLRLNRVVLVASDLSLYYIEKRDKHGVVTKNATNTFFNVVKYLNDSNEAEIKKINDALEYEDFGTVNLGIKSKPKRKIKSRTVKK